MILNELEQRLEKAAFEYFRTGLNLFHTSREHEGSSFQAALGNLVISLELLLKKCIVKKCPKYLFTNLPLELELKLTYPDSFPRLTNLQKRELNNFDFKSEQLNKCITIFFNLYPTKKQALKPYFNFISDIRNSAVHSITPNFQRVDLDRTGYLLLTIVEFLKNEKIISQNRFSLNEQDHNFLNRYSEERIDRLKKIIEKSKLKAKSIKDFTTISMEETWSNRLTKCPICKSDSYIDGYCEFEYEKTYDGAETYLTFISESFECIECNLKLFDQAELSYLGVELSKDISDFIPEYLEEHKYLDKLHDFD